MSKATKRTYIALLLAGLLYNIYLTCGACKTSNQKIPIQTEFSVFGINFNF
ncbi:hypothetical protein SAMN04488057_10490 [Cyclobacterium lianum]|uniref:Uncharacterized protein n=1 Tax=Cyclobacterium lianum TaxID=388280 RepID=A0A1M7M4K8_9BACT|nr:hypothetical protein SAMN04488057_10490 [Cyclobacterium lianum]